MSPVEVIFLTVSALTLTSGLIIVAINPWRLINRGYLLAASISATWLFCIFVAVHIGHSETYVDRSGNIVFWLRMSNAVAAFLPYFYFRIKEAIVGTSSITNRKSGLWLWFLASCLLAALAFSESFIPDRSSPEARLRGFGYAVYVLALSILCILIIYDAAKEMQRCDGIHRLEIRFFVINFCLGTLATLIAFFAGTVFPLPALRYVAPFVVVGYFGITLWAICYHRVFDARQILAVLGQRLSSLGVLTTSICIADSYLAERLIEPLAMTISVFCGGLLTASWDRKVCHWLSLDAEQILTRPRAQIIEWAREDADAEKLRTRFEAFLREWCQTDSVTFHTLESQEPPNLVLKTADYGTTFPLLRQTGYITLETLARRKPDCEIHYSRSILAERTLSALVAVPRGSHSPSCVVAFGHKNSLRPYTYPDIQVLIELIELMDNILAQARVAMRTAQIEKMEAAAMMSRGLAHDLNNLTTPVATFLLHMETRVGIGTPEADVLADAKHSIEIIQDYIRESLFFSRRLVPDFQNLSMSELLRSILKVTQTRAHNREVTVVVNGSDDINFIADHALMLRLMQNLVLNGIEVTPRGGRVTLSTGMTENGRVLFSVTDQGPGVPRELVERIFEPYFTTKDTGRDIRGLGLGLAVCLKISGLHGGEINISKTPCEGAVFTFSLPAHPARLTSSTDHPTLP